MATTGTGEPRGEEILARPKVTPKLTEDIHIIRAKYSSKQRGKL